MLQSLWKALPKYQARDWYHLKAHLLYLYPNTATLSRNTKQGLQKFLNKSAKYHVRNEADIMKYYRGFFLTATPLYDQDQITLDDYNTVFFLGFHPDIRDIIAERFIQVNPHHPVHEPFPVEGILDTAQHHFTSNHFHQIKVQKEKKCDKHCGHSKHHCKGLDVFIQRMYGDNSSRKKNWSCKEVSDSESD